MFVLTKDQAALFDSVNDGSNKQNYFVIRGYAGTGKTVTLSKLITDSRFKKFLVVAPTVKALSALQSKLPDDVKNKSLDFSTMSKLIQTPAEQIEVLEQPFRLNNADLYGEMGLKTLLQRINCWDDQIITERTVVKNTETKETEIKYLINEELLDSKLKNRFNGQSMMKPVEPVFDYKDENAIEKELKKYDVIMIDEMSMVSEDDICHLVKATKLLNYDFKLVMSGDKGQLPPVNGRLNHYFTKTSPEDVECYDLNDILRSTDEIAKVAQMIRNGIDIKQLAETVPNGRVTNSSAYEFCQQNSELLKSIDIALAFTNADVKVFNNEIRKAKGFSGKGANVGEPMIVLENSVIDNQGIVTFANGEEFTIIKKYDNSTTYDKVKDVFKSLDSTGELDFLRDEIYTYIEAQLVEMIDVVDVMGNIKTAFIPINFTTQYGYNWKNMKEAFKNFAKLNNGQLPLLHVDYSYARTIHKSQGSEWETVLLWLKSKDLWIMSNQDSINTRKLPYTGYTRAKSTCHLIFSTSK